MHKLISFDTNNKIVLDASSINHLHSIKEPLTIIAIIGEARLGKSTLLNIMISKIIGENVNIFQTSNRLKHQGTYGIDMYHCGKYLFLDCQGIAYQNSSNDVSILLIAYLLSHVIIFNVSMLNNNSLKLLEPIMLFGNHIDTNGLTEENKPELLFRVRDFEYDDPVETALSETLKPEKDHYESLRNVISQLFSKTSAIDTQPLKKKEKLLINDKNYVDFLKNTNNGFAKFTDSILKYNKSICIDDHLNKIKIIIDGLNNNKKIDCQKLNLVALRTEIELLEFLGTINENDFTGIVPNGTQTVYVNDITPRYAKFNEMEKVFNSKFSKIDSQIKSKFDKEIKKKSFDHVVKADELNKNISNKLVIGHIDEVFGKFKTQINGLFVVPKLSTWELEEWKVYDNMPSSRKIFLNILATGDQMPSLKIYKNILDTYNAKYCNILQSTIDEYSPTVEQLIENIKKTKKQFIEDIIKSEYAMCDEINTVINRVIDLKYLNTYLTILTDSHPINSIDPTLCKAEQPFIAAVCGKFEKEHTSIMSKYNQQIYYTTSLSVVDGKLQIIRNNNNISKYLMREDMTLNNCLATIKNKILNDTTFDEIYKIELEKKIRYVFKHCDYNTFKSIAMANTAMKFVWRSLSHSQPKNATNIIYDMFVNKCNNKFFFEKDFLQLFDEYIGRVDRKFTLHNLKEIFSTSITDNIFCIDLRDCDKNSIKYKYVKQKCVDYLGKSIFDAL